MREGVPREFVTPPDALATDLDGTLTAGGSPLGYKLVQALRGVKEVGSKLILVTGRCVADANRITGEGLFDAVVAENGAVLLAGGMKKKVEPPGWAKVRSRFLSRFGEGCEEVIVSTGAGELALARSLAAGDADVELNKDRLMVVPPGIDKGTGLAEALALLRLAPERTACIGDGENDAPMFEVVGMKVAVGNSVEGLKAKADLVTERGDGEGAIEAIEKLFPRGTLQEESRR